VIKEESIMMSVYEKKKAVRSRIRELIEEHAPEFASSITVEFSNRMTTTAGTATTNVLSKTSTLKFSVPIMSNPNNDFDKYLQTTVPHELAHAIAILLYGSHFGGGHGRTGKMVYKEISGLKTMDITRCHSYEVVRRPTKKYIYTCGCVDKNHFISGRMHTSIQRDGRNRRCNRCYDRIVFSGYMTTK